MNNLVLVDKKEIYTTSNIISEEFGISHNEVLKKIRKLSGEILPVRFSENFKEFDYKNERGRVYTSYKISKDGYMFLIMNISTKKAHDKKWLFIDAFKKMEQMLLNQSNSEWLTAREQGKLVRAGETDVIKKFVEYALASGSTGAAHYYKHFTSATYKALSLLEHRKPKTRDTLDMLELHQLVLAEHIVTSVIADEMESGEHYKVIFEKCNNALEKFADSLYLKRK